MTSYLEATQWFWKQDIPQYIAFHKLSFCQRIAQMLQDCIVYAIARIINVHDETKVKKVSKSIQDDYDNFVKARSYVPENKSIILILTIDLDLPVSIQGYKNLEEQSGFQIVFQKIYSSYDIMKFVSSVTKRSNVIKLLWIRAHGSRQTIFFSDYGATLSCQDLSVQNMLLKALFSLDAEAPIILECCFTGQVLENQGNKENKENIAQFIKKCANERTVYAPSREALSIDNTVTFNDGFHVTIEGIKASTRYPKMSFLARIHALWFAYRFIKEDITMKF
jgi:hypothetical protein